MSKLQSLVAIASFVALATGVFLSQVIQPATPKPVSVVADVTNEAGAPELMNILVTNDSHLPVADNTNGEIATIVNEVVPQVLGLSTSNPPIKKTATTKKSAPKPVPVKNVNKPKSTNVNTSVNRNTNTTPIQNTNTAVNSTTNTATNISTNTSGGTTLNVEITYYGSYDNDPAGSLDISNPVLHKQAGGTGTYADPLTFASPSGAGAYQVGARIYVPSVQKYFIKEDECATSWTAPNGCGAVSHVDLYVGNPSNSKAVLACEEALTPNGKAAIILNPSSTLPYDPTPIWNQSTGSCMRLH